MVLAAVDDLLFSSKIRATAKQAGVEVKFARSPEEIMSQVRELRPTLVIFDLNSGKTNPIEVIAQLRQDPETAGVRTLAFASHVHVDLIDAARQAGADTVMPRSAFAGRLADILLSGQSPD